MYAGKSEIGKKNSKKKKKKVWKTATSKENDDIQLSPFKKILDNFPTVAIHPRYLVNFSLYVSTFNFYK